MIKDIARVEALPDGRYVRSTFLPSVLIDCMQGPCFRLPEDYPHDGVEVTRSEPGGSPTFRVLHNKMGEK